MLGRCADQSEVGEPSKNIYPYTLARYTRAVYIVDIKQGDRDMKLKTANKEIRQVLTEDGVVVDVAPVGTWQCAGEWAESLIKMNADTETSWYYEGASEDGNIKTYIVSGDAYRYEMKTI